MSTHLPAPTTADPAARVDALARRSTPTASSACRAPGCASPGAPRRTRRRSATRCAGLARESGTGDPVASDESIGVVAPGPGLESGEERRYAVRIATADRLVGLERRPRGRGIRRRGRARGPPDRRVRAGRGPGHAAAHGCRAAGRAGGGAPARHLLGRRRAADQRPPRHRRAPRPRLDRVPAPDRARHVGRDGPAAGRREHARRAPRRRLVPRPARLGGRDRAVRHRARRARAARRRVRRRLARARRDVARVDDVDRRHPLGRALRRRGDRSPRRARGMGRAGLRRLATGRRLARSRSTRRSSSRASPAASARSASGRSSREPAATARSSTRARTSRGGSASSCAAGPATASRCATPRCSSPTGRSTPRRCGPHAATDGYVLAHDGETTLEPPSRSTASSTPR